jgi:hypothetical protein
MAIVLCHWIAQLQYIRSSKAIQYTYVPMQFSEGPLVYSDHDRLILEHFCFIQYTHCSLVHVSMYYVRISHIRTYVHRMHTGNGIK